MTEINLPYLYTQQEWNGRLMEIPMNHRLVQYSEVKPAPWETAVTYMVDCRHVAFSAPSRYLDEGEPNLTFDVTMELPLGRGGELYYSWFGRVRNFKLHGLNGTGDALVVTYRGQSVCHLHEAHSYVPGRVNCGLYEALVSEDPSLKGENLEEELYDLHICEGRIEDAPWLAFEVGQSLALHPELEFLLDDVPDEADFWSASLADVQKWLRYAGDHTYIEDVTVEGRTYRLIIATHED